MAALSVAQLSALEMGPCGDGDVHSNVFEAVEAGPVHQEGTAQPPQQGPFLRVAAPTHPLSHPAVQQAIRFAQGRQYHTLRGNCIQARLPTPLSSGYGSGPGSGRSEQETCFHADSSVTGAEGLRFLALCTKSNQSEGACRVYYRRPTMTELLPRTPLSECKDMGAQCVSASSTFGFACFHSWLPLASPGML